MVPPDNKRRLLRVNDNVMTFEDEERTFVLLATDTTIPSYIPSCAILIGVASETVNSISRTTWARANRSTSHDGKRGLEGGGMGMKFRSLRAALVPLLSTAS